MPYKTIVLGLLEQRKGLYRELCRRQKTLQTVNQLALILKTRHDALKSRLWDQRPESEASQTASETLELAIREIQNLLSCCEHREPPEAHSLDAAMEFLRVVKPSV
ncbi:MAG: hypothetical protein NT069_33400 [Planctomycetota bacterium]|nr:hypothetical protein [Planctomycetota bacterium]